MEKDAECFKMIKINKSKSLTHIYIHTCTYIYMHIEIIGTLVAFVGICLEVQQFLHFSQYRLPKEPIKI